MGDSAGSDKQDSGDSLATVISGGALVSAGRILALGFGFLIQIVMARFLTQNAYGDVVLTLAVVNLVAMVAKLGIDDGLMRQLPEFEDDPAKTRGIVRAAFSLAVVSGLATGATLFLSAPVLAERVFDDPSVTQVLRIGAFGVPFVVVRATSVGVARGLRDARTHTYVDQIAEPFSRLLLVSALVFAGFSATGAVVGQIGAFVIAGVLALFFAWQRLPSFDVQAVSMYKTVLVFSVPLIAVQGMSVAVSQVDIYFLGYFMNSTIVGNYNIVLQLSNLFYPIVTSLGFLLPPVLARLQADGKTQEMIRTYQLLTKWIIIIAMPLLIVFIFAPAQVIELLFGERYTAGTTALRILAIGNFISVCTGNNAGALISLGRNRIVAVFVLAQLILNGVLDLALIPEFGMSGAALATVVSILFNNFLSILALYFLFGVHPVTREAFLPVAIVGALSAAGYVIVSTLGYPLPIVILLIGVLYPLIVVRLVLEPEDEELLSRFEAQTGKDLTVVRQVVKALR
ncbi:flippase [Salinigranum salinum]|uniref:flippase n=1 Tax=Salinigranum salinum TaxID=1364937 RepID=UPI001261289C|nr:flippase [Salinigranum salinum]